MEVVLLESNYTPYYTLSSIAALLAEKLRSLVHASDLRRPPPPLYYYYYYYAMYEIAASVDCHIAANIYCDALFQRATTTTQIS